MKNTIVILTNNTQEAMIASSNTPQSPDYIRFFIILGDKVTNYSWLPASDKIMALSNIPENNDFLTLGIKLGVLYTLSSNLIFCKPKNYLSETEIKSIFTQLDNADSLTPITTDKCLAFSREYFALYGFPSDMAQSLETSEQEEGDKIKLAFAMKGQPCSDSIIVQILQEMAHFTDVFVDYAIYNEADPIVNFWNTLKTKITSYNPQNPKTFLLPSSTKKEKLVEYRSKLQPDGVIIVATLNPEELTEHIIPFQTLLTDNGVHILVYSYARNP